MIGENLFADLDATAAEHGWTRDESPYWDRVRRRYDRGDHTVRVYATSTGTQVMAAELTVDRHLRMKLTGKHAGKRATVGQWLKEPV